MDDRALHSRATKGNQNDGWEVGGEGGGGRREEDKATSDEEDGQGRTYPWAVGIEQDTQEERGGEIDGGGHDEETVDSIST